MGKYVAESERLWLQPLSVEDHLDDYHEIMSDSRLVTWSSRLESKNIEESEAMLRTRVPPSENPFMENYAILIKPLTPLGGATPESKPKMIGAVGTPRSTASAIEIGYWLHADYHGRGYATEALRLFIDLYWAPERRGGAKDTITAEIDPDNAASEKVVAKLGFTRGEILEDTYQLATDIRDKTGAKRQLRIWRLTRPK